MREKAKKTALWTIALTVLFGAGMFMGGGGPSASAQTDILVQGRFIFIDKSNEKDPRHYLMFDTQSGTLREWTQEPDMAVYLYEFDSPKEIKVNTTSIRR
jgi:hypothetical protein